MDITGLKYLDEKITSYYFCLGNKNILFDFGNNTINLQTLAKLDIIFISHYHYDHIGALDYFVNKYDIPVFDYRSLGLRKVKNFKFEVIPTKGHSKDSVSFYFKDSNDMFVGDFIFYETIGRTDLTGGDEEEMAYSLMSLRKMDEAIKLYPGHGQLTTLSHELKYNPYL